MTRTCQTWRRTCNNDREHSTYPKALAAAHCPCARAPVQPVPAPPPPFPSAHALARACLWDGRVKVFRNRLNSMEIAFGIPGSNKQKVTTEFPVAPPCTCASGRRPCAVAQASHVCVARGKGTTWAHEARQTAHVCSRGPGGAAAGTTCAGGSGARAAGASAGGGNGDANTVGGGAARSRAAQRGLARVACGARACTAWESRGVGSARRSSG